VTARPDHLRPVEAVCAHCGLEVPAGLVREGEAEQFCCNGCRQVHGMLQELGFEGYYDLLDRQGLRAEPAQVSGRSFEDFDDPALLGQIAEPGGRESLRARLYLDGVHCAACVWLVEELPRAVDGLAGVRLNLATSVAEVEWDPSQVQLSRVARALDSIGYTPHAQRGKAVEEARRDEDRALLIKVGVAAVCAMNIMFVHVALYAGEHFGIDPRYEQFFRWLSLLVSLPVVFFAARPFFRAAWAGLRQRVPHIDLPIAIALAAAFLFSAVSTVSGSGPVYFDSLAALVALLLAARYLQQRAQRLALARTAGLRSVAFVEYARRLDAGGLAREVPTHALACGDLVEVRSGELVPADGLVIEGRSSLDNSVLTGEPEPIGVGVGDGVYAGATNLGARLVLRVQATGEATRVGALLAMVDEAAARRAPIVKLADRLSRVFVLVVLGLAAGAGSLALIRGEGDVGLALQQIVALLVITCPCALGLATPVALTIGMARAASSGIFFKNQDAVEELNRIDTVVLDKTGTLTEGRPTVGGWRGDTEAVDLAYALEAESVHPIAAAFRRSSPTPVRAARAVTETREVAGLGIAGRVDGRLVAVGNRKMMDKAGAVSTSELDAAAAELLAAGDSPIFVAVGGAVVAVGGIAVRLRPDAASTVGELHRQGIRVRIFSGDHAEVVSRIGAALGVGPEDARGGMTPEAKRDQIEQLVAARPARARRGRVMMVGDGVNDAAALALADVGVAVQGGTGASVVAADIVLTRPGLGPLVDTLGGARRLLGVVWRNLAFSLVYNIVGASLALAGLVGPLVAAVLMPVSSLTVIGSSVVGAKFRTAAPHAAGAREG
jgi:Cu2+-exporting ATPase